MSQLRALIERVAQAGALECAPRELALARAHYGFARTELDIGDVVRAERHIALAEQNVGAAQVLTPDRGCKSSGDQVPAIAGSSASVRGALREHGAEADGGSVSAAFPAGAVKNTDAICLIGSVRTRPDTASLLPVCQLREREWSRSSSDRLDVQQLADDVKATRLTPHVYGETRLDEAIVMKYVALSVGESKLWR